MGNSFVHLKGKLRFCDLGLLLLLAVGGYTPTEEKATILRTRGQGDAKEPRGQPERIRALEHGHILSIPFL